MLGLIKKIFMGLIINIVSASNHTKCFSLNNQKCEIQKKYVFQKNRRFKSQCVQHDYKNKWIKNINKAYIMRM